MSDGIIALIIPLVALAIIVVWVPFLNLICPPRGRSLEQEALEVRAFMGSIRH